MSEQATEAGQEQPAAPQAEKSLDDLLAEFDQPQGSETQPAPEAPPQAPQGATTVPQDSRLEKVLSYVESDMAAKQQTALDDAINGEVRQMAALEDLKAVSEKRLRDALIAAAYDDPRVGQAFENRSQNPAAWSAIREQIAKGIAGETAPQSDQQLTQDMIAARASVQGTSATAPPEPEGPTPEEKFNMSGQAFQEEMRRKYGI